jgi:single-strand DNA-binding protein
MRTVNEVILVWWVANDPLLKETQNWQKLSVFNLATKRTWITKNGEKKEESQFHKLACWGRLWEKAVKLLSKWDLVYIRWYLHNRRIEIEWEEKARILTEIVVNDLLLVNKKNRETANNTENEE